MERTKTNKPAGRFSLRSGPRDYLVALVSVLLVVAACFPAAPYIGYQSVGLIFVMVIALLSLFLGRGAVFFAAILSSVTWNFFFIPPLFTLQIHSVHDLISLVANLMVALVGATLITRIRKSQIDLLKSRERLKALNAFLESLNNATSIKDVVRRSQESFRHYFHADIVIFLKEIGGTGLARRSFGDAGLFGEHTWEEAEKAFMGGPGPQERFHPLRDPRGTFGVIGIRYDGDIVPDEPTRTLAGGFIAQVTSALEREISVDLAKSSEISQESEKLFGTVLNSVSHELRTPIAIITTAVSNLQDPATAAAPGVREQITEELGAAAKRLDFIVENILDMSRIESGRMKLNLALCDPEDLAGMALQSLGRELKDHPPQVTVQDNIQPVRGDISLLVQALVNILHNASVYSPPGAPVTVAVEASQLGNVSITVSDRGSGVPEQALARLFDKFYRVPGSHSGGTGLGLTIAKAIAAAHHGTLRAANIPGGGLAVTLELPVADAGQETGYSQEQQDQT